MSEKVTFQELIDSIAEETNNSKKFTHDFLKDLVSVINSGLEQDGSVNIAGFGKFKLRRMEEREGYNPQTGEKMTIEAHNKVVFKPYKELRELVNAPYSDLESELVEEEEPEAPQEVAEETSEAEEITGDDKEKEQGFIPTGPPPAVKSDVEEESETGEEEAPWGEEEDEEMEQETREDPFGISASDTEPPEEDDDEDVVEYQAPEPEKREPSPLDEHLSQAKKESEQKAGSAEDQAEPDEEEEVETEPEPEEEPEPVMAFKSDSEEESTGSFLSSLQQKQPPWVWGAAAVIGLLLIVLLVLYFSTGNGTRQPSDTMATTQPQQQAQTEEVTEQPETRETQPAAPAESESQPEPEDAAQTTRQEGAPEQPRKLQQNDPVVRSVSRGQTLWGLAETEYDDPYLWPWIYDANKASIGNPDIILVGQTLSIPVPDEANNGLSSSDSLEVAIGYVETYRWYKNNGNGQAKYYLWAAKLYDQNVFDHITQPIDEDDLAFANRVR